MHTYAMMHEYDATCNSGHWRQAYTTALAGRPAGASRVSVVWLQGGQCHVAVNTKVIRARHPPATTARPQTHRTSPDPVLTPAAGLP